MVDSESGFIYTLEDAEVFVSSRPRKLMTIHSESAVFKADAYLSVTDTFCAPVEGKIFTWVPWNEQRHPTPEFFYAVNRTLNWWLQREKRKKIQIFCDVGSHRSVTAFGAYLMTYFGREERLKIVAGRKAVPLNRDYCDPLEYIGKYLEKFPEYGLLFNEMGEDRMSRLDNLSTNIVNRIQTLYGNKGSFL